MILFVSIRKRKFNDYSIMGYLKNGSKNLNNFQFHIETIIKTLISIMVYRPTYFLLPQLLQTSQQPDRLCASLFGRFIYSSHFNVQQFKRFQKSSRKSLLTSRIPLYRPALLLRITRIDATSSTSFTPTLPSMQTGQDYLSSGSIIPIIFYILSFIHFIYNCLQHLYKFRTGS